jgi:hypothetical protein
MRIDTTKPRSAWEYLDDSPSLATLRELLSAVPHGQLLESLLRSCGKGRTNPVHVLWGVLLLATALQHPTIEACLAELCRNAALRRLIGIESEKQVRKKWNMSRFQEVLDQEPHTTHLKTIFSRLVKQLGTWCRIWTRTRRGCHGPQCAAQARRRQPRPKWPQDCPRPAEAARNTRTMRGT